MPKTAGIIIIGDEILTGKVQDDNAFFMAKELFAHGIHLRRISVIPDSTDEIAEEVRTFSEWYDYVFTSGGIGPTHDDVTIEGIAKAFGVKPVIDPILRETLEKRQGTLSKEQLKMAEVPEGSELFTDETLSFPLIRFRNIYIFPGIPQLLRRKFVAIEKLFNEPLIRVKKVYLKASESGIAPILNEMVGCYKDVKIGSYPVLENDDYTLMITMESLSDADLNTAVQCLVDRLPEGAFVRIG
ncbi:MAG: competence/damage-inducible protein A [Nitrospirota bacterium]